MHILLSLETGGCENGIVNLINNMETDRFKVSVCCLERIGELAERIAPDRKHLFLVQKNGRPRLKDLLQLARVFRRERVDIVHTHGWGTLVIGYLSAKLAGVQVVIHGEHGGVHMDSRKKVLVQRILYGLVDTTVTVSRDLQTRLAALFRVDENLFSPIINGVDAAKFSAGNSAVRNAIRSAYGIAADSCVIGSVGRLVPWKRHDVLIEAVGDLVREGRNVALLIVGDGPFRETLQSSIDARGMRDRVFLAGRQENVGDFLAAMDVFALTSSSKPSSGDTAGGKAPQSPPEFEGISNALLEAMACALPVVATNVGGTPEIVAHGETGYLFDAGDYPSLTRALGTLAGDPELRARMGASARARIENSYGLRNMMQNYQDLYLSIAGKKSVI
jgi:glycosyltransferase involved in cell wall biosynthesis